MGSGASHEEAQVVIVGGGYAGIMLAMHLRKVCGVTLIDPKDSFVNNVGALRACVEPQFTTKLFVPYDPSFGDSFVRGKVVGIDKNANTVTLEGGRAVKYTHLVLATGTTSPFPGKVTSAYPDITKDAGIQLYEGINEHIRNADTVVCVGGGAVGVELSAEVKADFPNKDVILVHSNQTLCSSRMKKKTQSNLHSSMRKLGITMMLGERVSNLDEIKLNIYEKDQVLRTESGKEIKADLIFPCTGMKANTAIFKDALGASMTENGMLKVDKFFKVEGTDNIFSIGDIANFDEEKMAYTAGVHAQLLAQNIKAELHGKPPKPYKTGGFAMVVSLGRNGGVGEFNGFVLGNFPVRNLKSKDLFYGRYWDIMKQKVP